MSALHHIVGLMECKCDACFEERKCPHILASGKRCTVEGEPGHILHIAEART